jgi:tetratricopeptide (TPR) repeat protein
VSTRPGSEIRRESKHYRIKGAVIALLVLAAYMPALRSGYIWDDDVYVTNNPMLQSVEGLWSSWTHLSANVQYYPLVFTSFWLEYHVWQLNPFGYHLVNVVLQLLNALLVWHILRRLEVRGAWLAAAVFAIHPVHVESVAWITERKNVLSGFFYLASMAAYLRFADDWRDDVSGNDGGTSGRAWGVYALAFLLFAFALLSKTVTVTLPVILLVVAWWKRGRLEKQDVLPLVPFLFLAAVIGSVTPYLERVQVGATGSEWHLTLVERALIAGRAIWFYLGKLLLPVRLIFSYPRWSVDASRWWQYLFPVSALAAIIVMYRKRESIGRGPLAAILFFVITLAPALGFFDIYPMRYSFVADHFQYLASLGPIVLVSAMLSKAADGFTGGQTRDAALGSQLATLGLVSLLLVPLAALTWRQSSIYRNEITLWTDTILKNRDSWMAYNNLGLFYYRQGDLGRALPLFQKSVQIKPDNAEAHYNLALVLRGIGMEADAASHFRIADRLRPRKGGRS